MAAIEIDLTQWEDTDLRADVRRCMHALSLLTEGSPAYAGLTHAIISAVAELGRRCPAKPEHTRATVCRCGEVLLTCDDATVHFVTVFVPGNKVGVDGHVHEELTVPDGQPVGWECPVPVSGHGAGPCEDGCRPGDQVS